MRTSGGILIGSIDMNENNITTVNNLSARTIFEGEKKLSTKYLPTISNTSPSSYLGADMQHQVY